MNYNELMVRDWAKDTKNDYYYQFESLWSLVNAEDYEPIPITKEILMKNGFIKTNSCYRYRKDEDQIQVFFFIDSIFVDVSNNTNQIMVEINYIHELQHAIRLCKIDKEIIF